MKEKDASHPKQSSEFFLWTQFFVLLVTCAAAFYPALRSSGKLIMLDNVVHLAQLKIIIRDLIPSYSWLCGWSMYDFAGFDSLMYYGQAGFVLPVALVKIFHFPIVTAYKLTLLTALFFPGLMFVRLLRPHTGHAGALFAGLGFIALHNVISPALGGIWNFFTALGFVFLFLDNLLTKEHTVRQVPLRGALLGAALWTHPYSIPVAAIFSAVYALRTKLKKLPLLIAPYLFAGVGTFFYTAPIIVTRHWLKPVPMPRNLNAALAGLIKQALFPFGTENVWGLCVFALFIISAVTYIAVLRKKENDPCRRFIDTLLLSFPLFLLFSSGLPGEYGQIKLLKALSLDGFRTMVPAQAVMLTMVAYLFKLPRFISGPKTASRAGKIVLVLCIAVCAVTANTIKNKGRQLLITSKDTIYYNYVNELRDWLTENVDKNSCRVLFQDTLGNSETQTLGASHIFADFGTDTGIQTMGTWSAGTLLPNEAAVSTESGSFMGRRISGLTNKYIYNYLQNYNIQFIVCCSKALFYKLHHTQMFSIVFDCPEFIVLELKPMFRDKSGWTNTKPDTTVSLDQDSRPFTPRMDWTATNTNVNEPIEFRFQYHPFWQADWNGNPIALFEGQNGNIVLIPRQSAEKAKLSLIYTFKPWPLFILSMLMCACLSLLCLVNLGSQAPQAATGQEEPDIHPTPAPTPDGHLSDTAETEHKNRSKNRKKKKRAQRRKHG